jgi:hypothetical protein
MRMDLGTVISNYNLHHLSPKPLAEERAKPVDPKKVRVQITGTSSRKAIVLSRAGIIPSPKNADLPEFNQNNRLNTSMRLVNVASPAEKLPVHRVPKEETMERILGYGIDQATG